MRDTYLQHASSSPAPLYEVLSVRSAEMPKHLKPGVWANLQFRGWEQIRFHICGVENGIWVPQTCVIFVPGLPLELELWRQVPVRVDGGRGTGRAAGVPWHGVRLATLDAQCSTGAARVAHTRTRTSAPPHAHAHTLAPKHARAHTSAHAHVLVVCGGAGTGKRARCWERSGWSRPGSSFSATRRCCLCSGSESTPPSLLLLQGIAIHPF